MSSSLPWWVSEYQGAKWTRTDLHLHTPGVHSFRCPAGLDPMNEDHKTKIVEEYVTQLHRNNIEIAAITDYNGIRVNWFMDIKKEAGKHGIVVLPGAELDFSSTGKYGLHVLAIFGPDVDPEVINTAISSIDARPTEKLFGPDGSHRSIEPSGGIYDAIRKLRTLKPLIIPAHPNDSKGLFTSYNYKEAARLINRIHPDAIECFRSKDLERLVSTNKIQMEVLNRIAGVVFSDPRSIEEIGTKTRPSGQKRATYLKLSTKAELEGIRLALADPEVMVKAGEPPGTDYTRILAVEVAGNGFMGGFRAVLSPELTGIIGGRGAGKSALIESVRYALDMPPFFETEYRASLPKHSLGSGGKVSVWVEKLMQGDVRRTYRIDRIYGEHPRVWEIGPDYSSENQVDITPNGIFVEDPLPLIFGQREIYAVATDQARRIRLVDDVIGQTASDKQLELKRKQEELKSNARQIVQLKNLLVKKEDKELRLREIEHELGIYEREGLIDKLKDMTLLSTDEEYLRRIFEGINEVDRTIETLETAIDGYKQKTALLAARAKSPNGHILQSAAELVNTLCSKGTEAISSLKQEIVSTREGFEKLKTAWQNAKMPFDKTIQEVKQSLGSKTLDPDNLEILTKEKTRVEAEIENLERTKKALYECEKARREKLKELQNARYAVFTVRQRQADELNKRLHGRVKTEVGYKENTKHFLGQLVPLMTGSKVDRATIQKLCASKEMPFADGQHIAESIRKGQDELVRLFEISPVRANQIISWFEQSDSLLFELETLFPDDEVRISMSIDDTDIPIEKLSDGQRATAILMILLQQQDRLLVIDQPEDDLDNRFVYEGVVTLLREQKGKRQIVAATHNPNIPVLGNAELVLVLAAQDGKVYLDEAGSIDKLAVRESVKSIMEGGEDAFRNRARKYGQLDEEVKQ